MRLEVKRVAVVVRESGSEKSEEATKLQRLLISQGNALWNRHFQTSLSEDDPLPPVTPSLIVGHKLECLAQLTSREVHMHEFRRDRRPATKLVQQSLSR